MVSLPQSKPLPDNNMMPVDYDTSVKIAERFEKIVPSAGVHPRLYIRESDLEDLRDRVNDPLLIWYGAVGRPNLYYTSKGVFCL